MERLGYRKDKDCKKVEDERHDAGFKRKLEGSKKKEENGQEKKEEREIGE